MRVREKFLNSSEEVVFRELKSIADDNSFVAFAKPRLLDVLEKERFLTSAEFSMFSSAHFDFLLTDQNHAPLLAIEYDGPTHLSEAQIQRDKIKNLLCLESGLPLIRISASSGRARSTIICRCCTRTSWPSLSRPSTSCSTESSKGVDARHKAGHDR